MLNFLQVVVSSSKKLHEIHHAENALKFAIPTEAHCFEGCIGHEDNAPFALGMSHLSAMVTSGGEVCVLAQLT